MKDVWKFLDDVHDISSLPSENIPEIVFWGRSNVGKSSLINSITNSSIAKTSKTTGRTRSLVLFQLEKRLRIVDFPGYGYSKIPLNIEHQINKIIDQYLKKRKCIEKLFLLIDSKHGFKEKDKEIIKELDILFKDKVFIIFTKKDRVNNLNEKENLKKHNEKASNLFNKKFFNTSIKEINTIILLKKFMMNSSVRNNENIK